MGSLFKDVEEIGYGLTAEATTPASMPAAERIGVWLLRAALGAALVLCGVLIFWMWFDNVYGASIFCDIGGLILLLLILLLSGWVWEAQ
jgi:hypothetical protein